MVGQRAAETCALSRSLRIEGGFVLPFVVFMLFAVSIAGITGYIVVSSEFTLAKGNSDGAEALTVARAGLERFAAEQLGTMPDTVSYALGDGVAVVTARKLLAQDSLTDLYYIQSEATVIDRLAPDAPSRRIVGAYATHRRRPIPHYATVMIGADRIDVANGGEAHGRDYHNRPDCSGGGASTITGAIARLTVTEGNGNDIQGSPQWETWASGSSAMLDSIRVRWDVLTDPQFPVDFENTMPDFGTLPSDSFPVIRYTGWMGTGAVGRGVLIVDGVFDPWSSFSWDGIILASHVDDIVQGEIDGILVGGLDGPNMYSTIDFRTDANYHSCFVYAANESLSYLELMPNTIHEVF